MSTPLRRWITEATLTVGLLLVGMGGAPSYAASQQPSDTLGAPAPSPTEDRLPVPASGTTPDRPRPPAVVGAVDPGPIPLYDAIIEGGRIVDGTGDPWYYGDVGIRGDRIIRITPPGELVSAWTRERIDATDRVVAPGFIDIQSHSRYALLNGDGRVISKVSQGVTTEIMGEGTTDAPLDPRRISPDDVEDAERRAQLEAFSGPRGFDAWLRAMEAHGASVNLGSFIGGTSLRIYGRGYADGPPTAAQLDTMRAVTRRAMEDGAFGLATALVYPPGAYATTDELVEVSRAMAPYGGVYITHLRSEGDRFLEALAEALEIGRRSGVPVEIYHLKAAGTENWSKARRAVAMIDSARVEGQDVQATLYPYTAASTSLSACIPPWVSEGGRLYQNLEDPQIRRRVLGEMSADTGDWENFCRLATPEGVLLLGLQDPENRRWSGMRLSEVAERTGRRWP
ncbi:MAG: N-acyl-D-amino-acid deacylase family protein, partial [Longimicrobiales bacterium]